MTTITRKYYAMIPSMFSFDGEPYWLELGEAETLTSAQSYVDHFLGGLTNAEIWMSINGGDKAVVSKKDNTGQWVSVCEGKSDTHDPYANDQCQYTRGGKHVSREEFYKGFQQGKEDGMRNS